MAEILTTLFFIFAVIDPIGTIPVYLEATKEFDIIHKKKIAIRASIMAFLIVQPRLITAPGSTTDSSM